MKSDPTSRTLALIRGDIYSFTAPGRVDALFSEEGRIRLLGSNEAILAACNTETVVLDLRGGVVLPGFADLSAFLVSSEDDLRTIRARISLLKDSGVTFAQIDCNAERTDIVEKYLAALRTDETGRGANIALRPRFVVQNPSEGARLFDFLQSADTQAEAAMPFTPSVLVVLDGEIAERTAWLTTPYADAPTCRGEAYFTKEELASFLGMARARRVRVDLQASGDAAIDLALDAAPSGSCISGLHAPREDQFARIAACGHTVEFDPYSVGAYWDIAISRLGGERARTFCPWASLLKHGIPIGAASRGRAGGVPLSGIAATISRSDHAGNPRGGWMPSEALGRADAFWSHTGGASRVAGCPAARGTLARAASADMVVLMKNPFRVQADDMPYIEIGMVVAEGKIVKMK